MSTKSLKNRLDKLEKKAAEANTDKDVGELTHEEIGGVHFFTSNEIAGLNAAHKDIKVAYEEALRQIKILRNTT